MSGWVFTPGRVSNQVDGAAGAGFSAKTAATSSDVTATFRGRSVVLAGIATSVDAWKQFGSIAAFSATW
jgi:nucleoside phosphorylase